MSKKLQTSQAPNSPSYSLNDLLAAAKANSDGKGAPPVEQWNPPFCGDMDLVIRADGSWWHDGTRMSRDTLIRLFSTILRKDEDGKHYLVTPVEKIGITVERAPFIAARVDIEGSGQQQQVFFTTNVGDVVKLGPDCPLRVETHPETLEPAPFVLVRGRLEASLRRPVFYEIVDHASEIDTPEGKQLGLYSDGHFFPLGPVGAHLI